MPLTWALGTTLLPLTFHEKLLLPWAAPGIALMAAASAANLYGQDGTALWLTLMTGTERQDLRARQWAYLVIFGPITLAVAVVFTAWSGLSWAWPWVLALVPAMLGGGLGLAVLVSVVMLAPGPDAHKRPDNPLEHGDTVGQTNLMFWGGLLPTAPAIGLLAAGTALDNDLLLWAGVPVGVATGIVLPWWLGSVAIRRLQVRGPELLFLMRSGRPSTSVKLEIPKRDAYRAMFGWTFGSIALFPQGLVPIIFKLVHLDVKSWFLALYLPRVWQYPCAIAMTLFGCWCYYIAIRVSVSKKKAEPDGSDEPAERPAAELESVR